MEAVCDWLGQCSPTFCKEPEGVRKRVGMIPALDDWIKAVLNKF
jgi:hypothetical protein